jgi:hypothetical protein
MRKLHSIVVSALLHAFVIGTAGAADSAPLRVEGTEWVLQLADGAQMRSADLAGARLRLAGGTLLRIDAVRQVHDASGRRWWAHELSVQRPQEGWQSLCEAHSDGTHYAIVLSGRATADGSLAEDPDDFAISCTSGALAKCLRIGYEPWQPGPMRAAYNACVRMVRADYAGQGVPYTVNGRQIDVFDRVGIQAPDNDAAHEFEAGWDERGAVCVHHVRVAGKTTLAALEAAVPRLRGNVGEVCTEAHARSLGALVFNRSTPTSGAQH